MNSSYQSGLGGRTLFNTDYTNELLLLNPNWHIIFDLYRQFRSWVEHQTLHVTTLVQHLAYAYANINQVCSTNKNVLYYLKSQKARIHFSSLKFSSSRSLIPEEVWSQKKKLNGINFNTDEIHFSPLKFYPKLLKFFNSCSLIPEKVWSQKKKLNGINFNTDVMWLTCHQLK